MPSELIINEKWDTCLERTVINFGIGLVSAGVAGVVLTRESTVHQSLRGTGTCYVLIVDLESLAWALSRGSLGSVLVQPCDQAPKFSNH